MKRKRKNWKRFTLISGVIITVTITIFFSCQKDEIVPLDKNKSADQITNQELFPKPFFCGELVRKDLVLKNENKIGNAFFYNDNDNFYVHLVANRGYTFHNAYLFTGQFQDIPLNVNLNPDISAFNYQIISDDMSTVRKFKIPLTALTGTFDVSLMVQTKNSNFTWDEKMYKFERAWCQGKLYGNTLFGRFFSYRKGACMINTPAIEVE